MRNLIIAIVCAAALSSCKGQRVVAGDATAPQVASMPATAESVSSENQQTEKLIESAKHSKPVPETNVPMRTEVK